MNARTKSIILLFFTLLIGMVLGGIVNARLAEQRMERIASLRSSPGFVRFMQRSIEPQDEQQREAMEAILERAASRMAVVMERRRLELQEIMDSMRAELATVLTPEQMQQFEDQVDSRRRVFRERGPRRGPPPGRWPGGAPEGPPSPVP
jgi:hypothetical protein